MTYQISQIDHVCPPDTSRGAGQRIYWSQGFWFSGYVKLGDKKGKNPRCSHCNKKLANPIIFNSLSSKQGTHFNSSLKMEIKVPIIEISKLDRRRKK